MFTNASIVNSVKVDNDSTASGNPEDHGDSDHIDTDPGKSVEKDKVGEYEDNSGVVIII